MSQPMLFGEGPPLPQKDATPAATEASVNNANYQPKHTRLSLTPPSSRNAPPGTSEVSAERIAPKASALRLQVLAVIVAAGPTGLTDDEGERLSAIKVQTYTPRRGELAKAGFIERSDRKRLTLSGCPAAVWVATDAGKALVAG